MQKRPLYVLASLLAATEPDFGRGTLDRLKSGFRERYAADPIGTTALTVLVFGSLFYRAERGKNANVRTIYDALEFVSTSLSVGYSKIFPETPEGKLLATALMTFGPSMTAGALDTPSREDAITERLDRILAALERLQSVAAANTPRTNPGAAQTGGAGTGTC
jgi:voltage-gated potassium channel